MVEAGRSEVFGTAYLNLALGGRMKKGGAFIGAAPAVWAWLPFSWPGMGAKVVDCRRDDKAARVSLAPMSLLIARKRTRNAGVQSGKRGDGQRGRPNLGACLPPWPGGRWIISTSAGKCEIDARDFFRRGVYLIGSTLRSRSPK